MNKRILIGVCVGLVFQFHGLIGHAETEEPGLEDKLSKLKLPDNQVLPELKDEKLYSVQSRYVPLKFRNEVYGSSGTNLTPGSFINSWSIEVGDKFYLNDRFSIGLEGSYVFNSLNDSGNRLLETEGMIPDLAYVKYKANLMVGYNVFYGKFRLSMDHVFYFDQYVALGPGVVNLNTGTSVAGVADVGFVFWFAKRMSLRLGLKDYFFNEKRQKSNSFTNHLLWHADIGFLFGAGSSS